MIFYSTFPTAIGFCGIAWNDQQHLCAVQLAEPDERQTKKRLAERIQDPPIEAANLPPNIQSIIQRIQQHLEGEGDSFIDIPLAINHVSQFTREIYELTRRIPPGQIMSYSALATLAGRDGAARAVGQVMAKNPIPLIIPCHRVLAADGSLHGFSAPGDISTKLRLLTIEGVDLAPIVKAGIQILKRQDPRLAQVIRRVGPYRLLNQQRTDPFTALVEAIVHQQVSMKAGATIFQKLKMAVGANGALSPEHFTGILSDNLRQAGLSRQKTVYITDLAQKCSSGEMQLQRLERMDDELIIDSLTKVKGIGRWSAEMFLMFRLGRINVLPVDDLGLRKAAQKLYGLRQLPDARRLHELAKSWLPYRSIATWYLWRSLEVGGL